MQGTPEQRSRTGENPAIHRLQTTGRDSAHYTIWSSYHGKAIQVAFLGTNDYSLPSDFFVDDVQLNVTH